MTGPLVLDKATEEALHLYNARLAAQAENERAERRVQKAAKTKDDAAATVRSLENNPKATAEQRTEATAAYRGAVEAWERAKTGQPEPLAPSINDEPATDEPATDEPVSVEAEPEPATDEPVSDEAEPEAIEVEASAPAEVVEQSVLEGPVEGE